jgi:hypothetical protein
LAETAGEDKKKKIEEGGSTAPSMWITFSNYFFVSHITVQLKSEPVAVLFSEPGGIL